MQDDHRIISAEIVMGDLLIHFQGGKAALFSPRFLWSHRSQSGNIAIPDSAVVDEEPFILAELCTTYVASS